MSLERDENKVRTAMRAIHFDLVEAFHYLNQAFYSAGAVVAAKGGGSLRPMDQIAAALTSTRQAVESMDGYFRLDDKGEGMVNLGTLIGIAGLARSGKDTAALYLVQKFNLEVYSFAQPIKRGLMAMFGLSFDELEGARKEITLPWLGVSPRKLMQTVGTEWGREMIHPDIWVLNLQQQIEIDRARASVNSRPFGGVVVSDVRFENEAAWIRKNGGHIIHLRRPDALGVEGHASESGINLDTRDVVIHNTGTLDDLYLQLGSAMDSLPAVEAPA